MENGKIDINELVAKVRQTAFDLHAYLGTGLLEKVYENGLYHRLVKEGLSVERQKPLRVYDKDGFCLGDYFADLVVEGSLIVELKAVSNISNEHYAQILNYLKIAGAPAGLLINFGSYKFEVRTVIPRFTSSSSSTLLHGPTDAPTASSSSTLLHGQTDAPTASTSSTLLHGPTDAPTASTSSTLLHG